MHDTLPTAAREANEAARRRLLSRPGEPLFFADWERALFMHFEVDADALQRDVPYPLDLCEGRAYVSLVAFTIRDMRLRFGGPFGRWLCAPIATHEFLNCRAYVRHRGEPGIYFLTEWLSNPLSVRLGPLTFGLPYRYARCEYRHAHDTGRFDGRVVAAGSGDALRYEARLAEDAAFAVCQPESREEFLLERYTAFTAHRASRRYFRIWHEPWRQAPVEVSLSECGLLTARWEWFRGAKLVGGNYSPGVKQAWMGWPHRAGKSCPRRRLSGLFDLG